MNNAEKPQLTIPRVIGSLSFFNADNLEIMRGFKDNEFNLAIVDPPYGIGMGGGKIGNSKKDYKQFAGSDSCIPNAEYFAELRRISVHQIIWGGNYMIEHLQPTPCFIVWDKVQPEAFSMAMCEIAWTSFKSPAKIFKKRIVGADDVRIHPTQKPVALYEWIIKNYAQPNQKIIDTHLGSGSIAIAVEKANRLDKMNLQFVGIEIDKEYYEKALNRIEQYCRQGTLSF